MTLHFPEKSEVRLGRPPLNEVICQVKFSPILRISKETPSEFQDAIRGRFPGLEIEQGVLVQIPGLAGTEKPLVDASPRIYRFQTAEKATNISLAADFFALSTKRYTRWRVFIRDLEIAYEAVQQTYNPIFSTRVGLRFINRFTRKNTGLTKFDQVLDLFRSELTCLLRTDDWSDPHDMLSQLVLTDGKAKFALRTGFGKENGEPFFIIDLDYYEEGQIPLDTLMKRVNRYHDRIYAAFRWCLLDDSLQRFEPLNEGA